MVYEVVKYDDKNVESWDAFVNEAKNATFLFLRGFMDYHKVRFDDYSLMIYKNNKLVALLPANRVDNVIFSHQGLTYGGLILNSEIKIKDVINVFKSILEHLCNTNISSIHIKIIPTIYNSEPSDELSYLMFLVNAKLIKREALAVVDLKRNTKRSKGRMEGYKRGIKHQIKVIEETDFEVFWNNILLINLKSKHQASPVHSLSDIRLLKKRFPKKIRQFNVYKNDEIVAGTTVFETKHVAHLQYISGNADKNILGSLDFLHIHLIDHVFNEKAYFDFGISNENGGRSINGGLQFWKEGFGARTVVQDFYSVETKNYDLLNNVLL